jgi:hypothetical protein
MRLLPAGLAAPLLTLATHAHAHPGPPAASAWHGPASDTTGFVVAAVIAAVALWLALGD